MLSVISAHPGLSLDDLFHATAGAAEPDDIYMLIASGVINTDLSAAPLIDPQRVYLFQNGEPLALCRTTPSLQRDIPDAKVVGPVKEPNELSSLGPDQMAEANRRLQAIRVYQAGEPIADDVSLRTVRNWLQKYRRAEALYGNGFLGLFSRLQSVAIAHRGCLIRAGN